MRSFLGKSGGIARQNRSPHIERKLVVDVGKTFQQPHAKKARAARDKKRFPAGFGPELTRVLEHMLEVFEWKWFYGLKHSN